MLAVTTLSFALAAQSWLLSQDWMLGEGEDPGRPIFGSNALDTGREYYFFSLIFVVVGLFIARNVWRSGFGRRLRALRDNEDNARAFTVRDDGREAPGVRRRRVPRRARRRGLRTRALAAVQHGVPRRRRASTSSRWACSAASALMAGR